VLACYWKDFPLKEQDSSPPQIEVELLEKTNRCIGGGDATGSMGNDAVHQVAKILGGGTQWEVPLTEDSNRLR
jgi:hypothetical protein